MQTNPAVEQNKIVRWSESPCNQSGRKGKGLWRKGFTKRFGANCVTVVEVRPISSATACGPKILFLALHTTCSRLKYWRLSPITWGYAIT